MVKENKEVTEADKIWDEIKNKKLDLYALQGQVVADHVHKLAVPGEELLVKLNSSAVLPALESAVAPNFEVEVSENYTVVRRAIAPVDVSKLVEKK